PEAAAILFLPPNDHPQDSDLVELDGEGRICAFYPYPHDNDCYLPNLVNAALYIVRRDALLPWQEQRGMLDFGKTIFPEMLTKDLILVGYNSPEYIRDCGTPARIDQVCAAFAAGRIEQANLENPQPTVFLDRDGTINCYAGHIASTDQFELSKGVISAIKRLNESEYRAVVVTNQPVVARGDCSEAELRHIHKKMETLLGRGGAYIDRIYFCPHHPDRGFPGEIPELKKDCSCRKPKTGMIERAKKELNVNIECSWMVGDTTQDIMMAKNAGLRSILVESGVAGMDLKYFVTPDYIVPDLSAAVNFILDDHPRLLSYCKDLCTTIEKSDLVLIGGLSRSGKSIFASCVRETLQSEGKSAVVISLDRWLRSEAGRTSGVFGRYAMDEISALLASLTDRTTDMILELPAYDKLNRCRVECCECLAIGAKDVVILEGTVALDFTRLLKPWKPHTWFVDIDEEERRRRVLLEYKLRGFTSDQAEAVYLARQDDEMPYILKTAEEATLRVTLNLTKSMIE
ncbi:MAG: HAD-IIIA family hydrolase, partial [Syntrophales bacterium]|nr:HAD-IIIA family hydrolase [Syntrophales bacterium]